MSFALTKWRDPPDDRCIMRRKNDEVKGGEVPGERDSRPEQASSSGRPRRRPEGGAASWERREGFRATLFLHVPSPRERAALRRLGQMLYDALLDGARDSAEPASRFAARQLGAVLSELRFLEGFSGDVAELHRESERPAGASWSRVARGLARRLAHLAASLESDLERLDG